MNPVIIHIRTSTKEQNPENQLGDCLSIHLKEWGDYRLFEEKQSAWKDNTKREVLEEIKFLIKKGGIEHYIVWDFDRLYRNRQKFKDFLIFLKAYGVKLHSFRQSWLESLYKIPEPWNDIVYDLMVNIYGHIAQDESDRKSDRIKKAVRIVDGQTQSYKGQKWGRKAIPEDIKAEIIRRHGLGQKYRKIASEVFYWDSNNNKKNVSLGIVQKTIMETKGAKNRLKPVHQKVN